MSLDSTPFLQPYKMKTVNEPFFCLGFYELQTTKPEHGCKGHFSCKRCKISETFPTNTKVHNFYLKSYHYSVTAG